MPNGVTPRGAIYSVRIDVAGNIDGATVLAAQTPPFVKTGGIIVIALTDVGIIDPDLLGLSSAQTWLLSDMRIELAGAAGALALADILDDNGNTRFNLLEFAGLTIARYNGRRLMPPGSRIRINDQAVQAGNTIWLNLWAIQTTGEAISSVAN